MKMKVLREQFENMGAQKWMKMGSENNYSGRIKGGVEIL